jgi:hypothetical protein
MIDDRVIFKCLIQEITVLPDGGLINSFVIFNMWKNEASDVFRQVSGVNRSDMIKGKQGVGFHYGIPVQIGYLACMVRQIDIGYHVSQTA